MPVFGCRTVGAPESVLPLRSPRVRAIALLPSLCGFAALLRDRTQAAAVATSVAGACRLSPGLHDLQNAGNHLVDLPTFQLELFSARRGNRINARAPVILGKPPFRLHVFSAKQPLQRRIK